MSVLKNSVKICHGCGRDMRWDLSRCPFCDERQPGKGETMTNDKPEAGSSVPPLDPLPDLLKTMRQHADDVWHLPGHQDCARTLFDYANRFEAAVRAASPEKSERAVPPLDPLLSPKELDRLIERHQREAAQWEDYYTYRSQAERDSVGSRYHLHNDTAKTLAAVRAAAVSPQHTDEWYLRKAREEEGHEVTVNTDVAERAAVAPPTSPPTVVRTS